MKAILQTQAGNPENQDRGAVIECGPRLVLVVADGAGGLSGGAAAATMAVDLVSRDVSILDNADSCITLLQSLDRAIAQDKVAGETTCVLVVITKGEVYGASVGDSGAWLIGQNGLEDLTKHQIRKPFLGSGCALPVSFKHRVADGEMLLLATDGLFKYTSADRIENVCRQASSEAATKQLVELVRYPSGALPDDITIILANL